MAQKKQTRKVFQVQAIIKVTTMVEILADNLNDAFVQAAELDSEDFITHVGECFDIDFGIESVSAFPHAYNLKSNAQTI